MKDEGRTIEQLAKELAEMRQWLNKSELLRKRAEIELDKRDRLFQGVAEATKYLLAADNYVIAINKALAVLGEAVDVDRVYIFEHHLHPEAGEKVVSQRFEWARDAVAPQLDNPEQNSSYNAHGMTRWYEAFVAGRTVSGPIDEFPVAERELLERQGIVSLLVVPIFIGKRYWGFIGFDDCQTKRRWSKNEESILASVAACFGVALERRRVEEALYLSEERFFKAFNFSPNLMAICTFQGCFLDVNDNFLRVTGYRRREVLGHTIMELNNFLKKEDQDEIIRLLREQGKVHNLETSFFTRTGKMRVGLFSAEIITLKGKQCILYIINDITDRKQVEKEMARLDRLHLVGEMAACIGHEIRNPITTVRGFLQLFKSRWENVKDKEYFDLIIEELDRANAIITEFLSLAKNKAVDLKTRNLNTIVKALSPLLAADAISSSKHVVAELEDVPDLLLDEKEIRQLILNLVRNGLEAIPPGGKVTIRTFAEGDKIVLAVEDQGKGIEPEILKKIGTPFLTTKDNGTGLGLAVCYSIAARHKAEIKVETGAAGTTFCVRFKTKGE